MAAASPTPLAVAVLVKQVPRRSDELRLGGDGRLVRSGTENEMNPYCRRAVAAGIAAARDFGGRCTAVTLGPPGAEDCLREALACGADEGVLVTDPVFAGSDTLATARALAAALDRLGPFDLVLCGRNSVDADTAQMPAQLAELLDWPLACGVKQLSLAGGRAEVRCEHDDGRVSAQVALPAVLTCAERLISPAKASTQARAQVPAERLRTLTAAELGLGPWGSEASPTTVGEIRRPESRRWCLRYPADEEETVRAVTLLACHGAFDHLEGPDHRDGPAGRLFPPLDAAPAASGATGGVALPDVWDRGRPGRAVPGAGCEDGVLHGTVAVLAEPGRSGTTRGLLAAACRLAGNRGTVAVLVTEDLDPVLAGAWGADAVVPIVGAEAEEDTAAAVGQWCRETAPWAVLAPSTMWGREVAGRAAARLGAGLAGDVVEVEAQGSELVCWKPALSGALVAAVGFRSPIAMATVRPGVLAPEPLRRIRARVQTPVRARARGRMRVTERIREDDLELLSRARVVVAVGQGVPPEEYPRLQPLLDVLGAELAATRKVTDRGWQPRSRQIGVTGRSVAPRLFISIGASGGFNHLVGARAADLVLAVNSDPDAPAFDSADIGLVADWREAVPWLVKALHARLQRRAPAPATRTGEPEQVR